MIISLDTEKDFDKIQHPFVIKVLKRTEITKNIPNIIKTIYSKLRVSISLRKKLKAIALKSGIKPGCPLSSYLFSIVLEVDPS